MRIAVIGTGALGSTLLDLLAACSLQSVMLIDPDTVQERNLSLSPFLRRAFVAHGNATPSTSSRAMHKVDLLSAEAERAYRLEWETHTCEIADVGWQDLCAVDLLCCCTDNALSRAEMAFIAHMLNKPVLDGAVFGDGIAAGRVTIFSPESDAACYLCGMAEDRRAAVLGYAASVSMGCRVPEDTRSMTGTVAALECVAQMMLDRILQFASGSAWPRQSQAVRISLSKGDESTSLNPWRNEIITLTQSANCPWHGLVPGTLAPLPWTTPLAQSLPGNSEVYLAWPICTEAMCAVCKGRFTPFRRVAAVRDGIVCSHCGARGMEPVRVVHRLCHADPESALSPRQLGLPARHLYWLRDTAGMNRFVNEVAP